MNDGDDSTACFFCQVEGAFLKGPHGKGFGSGAFGEYQYGGAFLHLLFGL